MGVGVGVEVGVVLVCWRGLLICRVGCIDLT